MSNLPRALPKVCFTQSLALVGYGLKSYTSLVYTLATKSVLQQDKSLNISPHIQILSHSNSRIRICQEPQDH